MIKIEELIMYSLLGKCFKSLSYNQRKTIKKRKLISQFMEKRGIKYVSLDYYRVLYMCFSEDKETILKVIGYLGSKTYIHGHSSTMDAYKDLAYRNLGKLLKIDL